MTEGASAADFRDSTLGFGHLIQSIMTWKASMLYRRKCLLLAALIIVLLSGAAATGTPAAPDDARAAQPAPHTQTGQDAGALPAGPPMTMPATIEGFRHARFGMNEQQVRQSIGADFPNAAITRTVQPSEKTTILSVTVANLLPDTGNAEISYILGYRSKKLVQVNLVWTSDRSAAGDQGLVGAANSLRDYFMAQHYKPDSTVANRQVAEHTIIVFRASDLDGRTVLLVLSGTPTTAHAAKQAQPPLTLELAYIEDASHPDIFRIGQGQF
jgi:hypothetical protein